MVKIKFKAAARKSLGQEIADLGISTKEIVVVNGGESVEIETAADLSSSDEAKLKNLFKHKYKKDFVVV